MAKMRSSGLRTYECPSCRVKFKNSSGFCGICRRPGVPFSKMGNRLTVVDGETFHSGWEAERYGELQIWQRAGQIFGLERQVKFELWVPSPITGKTEKIGSYIADAVYKLDGKLVIEDAKGDLKTTAEFKLKQKLMKVLYGFDVIEVRRPPKVRRQYPRAKTSRRRR